MSHIRLQHDIRIYENHEMSSKILEDNQFFLMTVQQFQNLLKHLRENQWL